jgi:hypothetical protein
VRALVQQFRKTFELRNKDYSECRLLVASTVVMQAVNGKERGSLCAICLLPPKPHRDVSQRTSPTETTNKTVSWIPARVHVVRNQDEFVSAS